METNDSTIYGNLRTTIYQNLHTQALQVLVWASDEATIESICGPATYPDAKYAYRPRDPQWVDFLGDVDEITKEEAIERAENGLPVAVTFLTMMPKAPGMGIAAGRPNVVPSIKNGTQVFFPGLVAARGEGPGCATVQDAVRQGIRFFALEGRLVNCSGHIH